MTHPAVQALLLGLLATLFVLLRRPRLALGMAVLAVGWIWLASTPWLAVRMHATLATAFAPPATLPHADALVVLGGGKLPVNDWQAPDTRAGMGVALWRQGIATHVLVSGSDQARRMARGMHEAGVPEPMLVVEDASRTTHENAVNSAGMLRARGMSSIVLVTSAIHMPRAAGAFRREGIRVTAAPVDDGFATISTRPAWWPRRDALTLVARCLRENLALWVYRYRRWA